MAVRLDSYDEIARTAGDKRRLGLVSAHLANYLLLTGDAAGAAEDLAILPRLN